MTDTPQTTDEWTALEKLADAAMPNTSWGAEGKSTGEPTTEVAWLLGLHWRDRKSGGMSPEDAAYIVAAQPATIKRLIAAARSASRDRGVEADSEDAVAFAIQYGPRCRDCADENGVCPATGIGCGDREKAVRFVLGAVAYGIKHRYLPAPRLASEREVWEQAIKAAAAVARDWVMSDSGSITPNTDADEVAAAIGALSVSQPIPEATPTEALTVAREALERARDFISSEYGGHAEHMQGRTVDPVAEPAFNAICAALGAIDAAETERCIACDEPLRTGEMVLPDYSGGLIHVSCCGPERESYVGEDGEPLAPGEPIPVGTPYEPPAREALSVLEQTMGEGDDHPSPQRDLSPGAGKDAE